MDRNEIIAKMAVIGCLRTPQAQVAEECLKCEFQNSCNSYRHAQLLYDEGYQQPVVHAHWVPIKKRMYACNDPVGEIVTAYYKCSKCGLQEDGEYKYCRCGAKMDEKEKE